MELQYEELVKDHWWRLNSKLRMFSEGGPEFLDTWVPDEDHHRSIFGVFEAAANAGLKELSVTIEEDTQKTLDKNRLKENLSLLGQVSLNPRGKRILIELKFFETKGAITSLSDQTQKKEKVVPIREMPPLSNAPISIPIVHEAHKAGIEKALKNIRHEGPAPKAGEDQTLYEANEQGVRLSVLVDKQGIVVAASHQGAKEPAHRAILDALCGILLRRPIQEGRDHGIIRVESAFRDPNVKWPVPGLITAENTSRAFELPKKLLQKIFKEYIERSQVKLGWNFWDDPPSDSWMRASKAQQMERAQEALKHAAKELGVEPGIVEVVDIVNYTRIIIGYNKNTIRLDFAAKMMKMEKIVKELLEPRLELQLENLEDKNKRDSRTGRTTG